MDIVMAQLKTDHKLKRLLVTGLKETQRLGALWMLKPPISHLSKALGRKNRMSNYASHSVLKEIEPSQLWWKNTYEPSDTVPVSGIYICAGCKKEITSNKDDPFPPQNHHQHTAHQGKIRWKLNVRTNTTGD